MTTQVRNVAGEVIRDSLKVEADLKHALTWLPKSSQSHAISDVERNLKRLRDVRDAIERSIKFKLPFNGQLIDEDSAAMDSLSELSEEEAELIHLPYKTCFFVFDAYVQRNDSSFGSEPIVILCVENERNVVGYPITRGNYDKGEAPVWLPYDLAFLIRKADMIYHDEESKRGGLQYEVFLPMSGISDKTVELIIADGSPEREFIQNTVIVLMQIFKVMMCSNVVVEAIPGTGCSQRINAKRIAKGKQPLYEYHQLTVDSFGQHTVQPSHSSGSGTGSKKRQHLRRGHIRRYKSGKRIWIQAQMIGSKEFGRIDKEYQVKVQHG